MAADPALIVLPVSAVNAVLAHLRRQPWEEANPLIAGLMLGKPLDQVLREKLASSEKNAPPAADPEYK